MKYAIIKLSGKEIKVSEGDQIKVSRLKNLDPKVLMFVNNGHISIGDPYLEDIQVKLSLKAEEKGPKLTIRRFKAKSRYHKTRGFRPLLSVVNVDSISDKSDSEKKTAQEEPKSKPKSKKVSKEK